MFPMFLPTVRNFVQNCVEWTIQYFQLQDIIKRANIGFRLERSGNYLFNFELGDKNSTLTTHKFMENILSCFTHKNYSTIKIIHTF